MTRKKLGANDEGKPANPDQKHTERPQSATLTWKQRHILVRHDVTHALHFGLARAQLVAQRVTMRHARNLPHVHVEAPRVPFERVLLLHELHHVGPGVHSDWG